MAVIVHFTDFDYDFQASVRQLATAFSPMSKRHEELSTEENKVVGDLAGILRDEVPNCSFVQLVDTKPMPQSVKPACPETLVSFARSVDTSSGTTIGDQIDDLIMNSSLSDEECEALEVTTRLQSGCPEWRDHRSGRVTASNMKRVFTRVASLRVRDDDDPSALVKCVMSYTDTDISNYAVKHGVAMEPHAKNMFVRLMKRSHKGFSARDCGLVLYKPKQYIAATPDLVSTCQCCGTGVCEIKCPWNCRNKVPSHHNFAHLSRGVNDDTSVLLPNSPYMFQLQGQIACLGVEHGYFFVYSSHGYHLECVTFNQELWASMVERYEFFWMNYVAPELLTGAMLPVPSRAGAHLEDEHAYAGPRMCKPANTVSMGTVVGKKRVLTASKLPAVFLCGICGLDCKEGPSSLSQRSIECTKCKIWMHFVCVNL